MRKLFILLFALVPATVFAVTKADLDTSVKTTRDQCFAEVKGCKDLVEKASGSLVFPEVTKGGLGVAFESGKGALVEHGKITGYYKTSAASLGATIGVGSKSIIVVFRTPQELAKFKTSSGWEIGADAGVAMLDAGAAGTLDTANMKEGVVGIIFGESGVLADASIKGSNISPIDAKDLG